MTDGGGIIESLRREQKWLESIIGKIEPPDGKVLIIGNPKRGDYGVSWERESFGTDKGLNHDDRSPENV